MVNFFITRPIFASVVAIIMVIGGLVGYILLPVAQYPEIAPPQVVVSASYAGASAQTVADTVTTPLEQQINGVQGMSYISSISANDGTSTITITFEVGYDIDIAAVDVQNRVSQASAQLPAVVNLGGITIRKRQPNFTLLVSLLSPDGSVDPIALSNYAYLQLVDPIKRLTGAGDVTIFGEKRYSMRVWLDPDRLAQLGVTASEVQAAILEQNLQVVSGKLGQAPSPSNQAFEFQINTLGRLADVKQFEDIVVRAGGGSSAMVLLRDLGRVELGALSYNSNSYIGDKPTVSMAVYQAPGANGLELDKQVRAKMDELAARFPPGISYAVKYDTTEFVTASLEEVVITLVIALALVFVVVFVFLQSWRTTLIPAISIPVSLIGTLGIMKLFGFSINTVSLLGLVLAIGLVVDDAIVVVENVKRQMENGKSPLDAAKAAMAEVTGPIVATTAVLMAVFVPVAFLPGITGQLYLQFALTIAISVALSAINSLTLSPALCAVLLKPDAGEPWLVFRKFNAGFTWLADRYADSVRMTVRIWPVMFLLLAGAVGSTYFIFRDVPSSFVPVEDQGYFFIVVQLPAGAALTRTEDVVKQVRDLVKQRPEVDEVIAITGLDFLTSSQQSNSAVMFAILKPWGERHGEEHSAQSIVAALKPQLLGLPAAIALSFDPPAIPGLGTTGGFEFQVEDLTGKGAQALDEATQALLAEARKQPELDGQQLLTTFSTATPQLEFELDRKKAKQLGLNLEDVFTTMQVYLGSLYVNDFNLFGRTFRVTVQAEGKARADPLDFAHIYVRTATGGLLPLDAIGTLRPTTGPATIPHYNLYGSAQISGSPAAGFSSGQAIEAMERAAAVLPEGFGYEWTGVIYQQLKAGSVAILVFALALVFVFLVLAAQYESWTMPFMVLLTVPFALFGAMLTIWLRGLELNVYAEIGLIMLIGLAAKNAILIVEFAKTLREQGKDVLESATEAARLRLRPILMTALAFILGVVPLVVAEGAGAASRASLGTTVFGGMLAATILGLLFTPVFYVTIERLRERRQTPAEHGGAAAPQPAE
ncbi:MAG: multidrug efflux RND transporter permease subunit [Gemmatimonadaceae bacterium]|nr:multidrug efflux RND transporter permease subunit [Acetobacteraceae bacterium]